MLICTLDCIAGRRRCTWFHITGHVAMPIAALPATLRGTIWLQSSGGAALLVGKLKLNSLLDC